MQIIPVSHQNSSEFVQYCRRYGPEHDSSYTALDGFQPSPERPAYLLRIDGGIAGAVCLILSQEYRKARRARFMIFHTLNPHPESYRLLLQAARRHMEQFEAAYLFIPEGKHETRALWESLGFNIERYVYLLRRGNRPVAETNWPDPYRVAAIEKNEQAALRCFCMLWNKNFAASFGLPGISAAEAAGWFADACYLAGGLMLLYRGTIPVGTVNVYRDEEEEDAAFIDHLSIVPGCRGRGLGRLLLRRALLFARQPGLKKAYLTVNATNETALGLYLSEGFSKQSVMVCYNIPAGGRHSRE